MARACAWGKQIRRQGACARAHTEHAQTDKQTDTDTHTHTDTQSKAPPRWMQQGKAQTDTQGTHTISTAPHTSSTHRAPVPLPSHQGPLQGVHWAYWERADTSCELREPVRRGTHTHTHTCTRADIQTSTAVSVCLGGLKEGCSRAVRVCVCVCVYVQAGVCVYVSPVAVETGAAVLGS